MSVSPQSIDRVLAVVEAETDGDHACSHYLLARKVLGESKGFAHGVAVAFRHRKLTRADCERMVDGWDEDDCDRSNQNESSKAGASGKPNSQVPKKRTP